MNICTTAYVQAQEKPTEFIGPLPPKRTITPLAVVLIFPLQAQMNEDDFRRERQDKQQIKQQLAALRNQLQGVLQGPILASQVSVPSNPSLPVH